MRQRSLCDVVRVLALCDDWKCNVRGEDVHRMIGNESKMCWSVLYVLSLSF